MNFHDLFFLQVATLRCHLEVVAWARRSTLVESEVDGDGEHELDPVRAEPAETDDGLLRNSLTDYGLLRNSLKKHFYDAKVEM